MKSQPARSRVMLLLPDGFDYRLTQRSTAAIAGRGHGDERANRVCGPDRGHVPHRSGRKQQHYAEQEA